MESKQTTTTELEMRLAGPEGRALRDQLQRDLSTLELRLVARLAAMVPRSEFATLAACVEATRTAQRVLGT